MNDHRQLSDQQKRVRDHLFLQYVRQGLDEQIAWDKACFDVRSKTINYWERKGEIM